MVSKATRPRGARKAPEPPATPERKKSLLTQAGDEAKHAVERALLLKTLRKCEWNLSLTARTLEMGDASAVLRALDRYGVRAEYERSRPVAT